MRRRSFQREGACENASRAHDALRPPFTTHNPRYSMQIVVLNKVDMLDPATREAKVCLSVFALPRVSFTDVSPHSLTHTSSVDRWRK